VDKAMPDEPRTLDELAALAAREPLPAWDPATALPWADPGFSARVLATHLDPATPAATRSPADVARQLDWLGSQLSAGSVLDLCCGPGLYCHELARRGRTAVGLDAAPAAIAWARRTAADHRLDAHFHEADLADVLPLGALVPHAPYAAVTCWFGDIHNFPARAAAPLLEAACDLLADGGLLVLEMQPWEHTVQTDDLSAATVDSGLFCDRPHHWVQRLRWDAASDTEVHGHWIKSLESGTLQRYSQCLQAWRPDRLAGVLAACGLDHPVWHDPVVGLDAGFEFPLLTARRAAGPGGR
jgi:SAM-dependent methyltransferase